jgi:hypothetical protein
MDSNQPWQIRLGILTIIRVPLQETWEEAPYAEVKDVLI